ncbi:MAG: hypothetical protein JKY15_07345, partial [Deltaproteobacteria bacterium]|nr:hypothetical protein [Deltaproteobacteria bacterium]
MSWAILLIPTNFWLPMQKVGKRSFLASMAKRAGLRWRKSHITHKAVKSLAELTQARKAAEQKRKDYANRFVPIPVFSGYYLNIKTETCD